jgi:protein-S-isoprenylcysteine O-methyltransferase Ste14
MSLINSFEKSGNFLFKFRGHLPIVLFLLAIPVAIFNSNQFSIRNNQFGILIISFLFVFVGHLIRVLTVGKRSIQSSGRNRSHQVAKELNTTGIYSVVRHPLYLGNAFIWFGLLCFFGNLWFLIVCSLIYWIYYERIMFAEEQFLGRQFGENFNNWSIKVPALIPSFRNYVPSQLVFSWRVVFKNEYPGWISTMTSFLYLSILKRSASIQKIQFSKTDAYFALFILIFGLILKGLKKYSNIFHQMD